jgi:ribosomal protein S18 acetylase RimI-like enzyme
MTHENIHDLERLAAAAWPAAEVQALDGWLLRWNEGVTRRANSVWPNEAGEELTLDQKLAAVEDFYHGRGLPARYQICPAARPADLDALLAQHGYRQDAPTLVQVAPVGVVHEQTRSCLGLDVAIGERLTEDWFTTYCLADGIPEREQGPRRGILERIEDGVGFAAARLRTETIAVGLGVSAGGWLGLFCMGTRPEFRRRGAALAVLQTLAEWGGQRGAHDVYLQVMDNNAPARALYARAGLQTLYSYHYREKAVSRSAELRC